jgi:hypothetical protein
MAAADKKRSIQARTKPRFAADNRHLAAWLSKGIVLRRFDGCNEC